MTFPDMRVPPTSRRTFAVDDTDRRTTAASRGGRPG